MDLDATASTALALQWAAYYLFPLALWIGLTRRLSVSWRAIGLGALTWLTALPAIIAVPLGAMALFGDSDPALVWGTSLSLTAGVVEETSRYLWYRRSPNLRDPAGRRFALAAGAGHGGTEALVLGLQFAIAPILVVAFAPESLPPEFATNAAITRFALIGGTARILFVLGHIGLTLMVWRAVAWRRPGWYVGAVVLHIVLDLLAFVVPDLVPGSDWLIAIPTLGLVGFAVGSIVAETRGRRFALAGS